MLKYLIPFFLLTCLIETSYAASRVMKCIGTDGHVTYARTCLQSDTSSQIHINDSGNLTQNPVAGSDTSSNEPIPDNNASLEETVDDSTVPESDNTTDATSALSGGGSGGSGGSSSPVSNTDSASTDMGGETGDGSGDKSEIGSSETDIADADNSATVTEHDNTATANSDTDKEESDGSVDESDAGGSVVDRNMANDNVTSSPEPEASGMNIRKSTSSMTATTDSTDTDNSTINIAQSDRTPEKRNTFTNLTAIKNTEDASVETEEDVDIVEEDTDVVEEDTDIVEEEEVDTEVTTDIVYIDISESASNEYNHSVSYIKIDKENGEITVNGNDFGGGPDVILFDRFENGVSDGVIPLINSANPACWSNTSDLDTQDVQGPLVGCWSEYGTTRPRYSDIAYSGSHSMQIHKNGTGMLQFKKKFDKATEAFVSYQVHVPQTETSYFPGTYWYREDGTVGGIEDASHWEFPKDSSWKMNWLLQDGKLDQLYANMVLPTHVGQGIFHLAGNDNKLANLGRVDNWWSWHYWNRLSVWIKADTEDPLAPGVVLFQSMSQDMGFYEASISVPIFDDDGPTEKYFNSINFPGWVRPGSITEPLYDDVYIAIGPNAVSRVEIGNREKYRLSSKVEILQTSGWRNDKITLLYDSKRGLVPGENIYLYITDNQGRVNENGYPLYE